MILTHDKVLIQLDKHSDHTTTPSGLFNPKFLNIETDGGRPDIKLSNESYVAQGTVIDMSPYAAQRMKESLTPISIGDKVFVTKSAVSMNHHFDKDRNTILQEFDGLILIPFVLIEAILNEETN